ncbi:hypothetical protein IQ05_01268 [Flavobacterium tiangeerense]|uniref:Uncharacterized protein n=1 Tax=Flavobacterium tiangeerense TaxID=459471 RepID=A0ABY3FKU0_9FLAO|nr:hypothetical protein [Flavobacterium tiangeerense]TWI00611.1 hypothetical protein IQ05_01268 [Flavobacterium tiangeerense]
MQTTIGIIELNLARITDKLSKILVDNPVIDTKTKKVRRFTEELDLNAKQKFFEAKFYEIDTLIDRVVKHIK